MQGKMKEAENMKDEDKLYLFQGVLLPSIMCPEENMKALHDFQARADDVLLVAYPKCGFNWMVSVLRKIISKSTGREAESRPHPPLIEFMAPEQQKVVKDAPSPRLLGTHLHPDRIPASFYQQKTKMLVIFRNPKDTLVSYFHFSNKNPVLPAVDWDSFYSDFMKGNVAWGSYFQHALAWNKKMEDPNVKVLTYEELKKDLGGCVRQISEFFGFALTEFQVKEIAGESTFDAMKNSSSGSHGNLGNVFFRKGEVGDWKNHFSSEQSAEMDEAFKDQLERTKLGDVLNYKQWC
ncbi:sulfotransferase 6B1-like [Gouania willdenowi]|uniref:sulfotransferase 6B1-like n=1 Tax=Gouania willdenowi TaxID=441366 RepID=UPI001054C535|nr:sulfotransferase 6B1-like [Gouania willdenowi]